MTKLNLLICLNNTHNKQDQSFFKKDLIPAIGAQFPQIQVFYAEDLKAAQHKISQSHFAAVIVTAVFKEHPKRLCHISHF